MLAETKVRPIPESQQPTEIVRLYILAKLVLEISKDRKEEKAMEIEKANRKRIRISGKDVPIEVRHPSNGPLDWIVEPVTG